MANAKKIEKAARKCKDDAIKAYGRHMDNAKSFAESAIRCINDGTLYTAKKELRRALENLEKAEAHREVAIEMLNVLTEED